jgi:uncharacterized protein (TIGR02996 family)
MPPENRQTLYEWIRSLPVPAQYRVLRHELLRRISRSRLADNYILRGSSVLKHWFPNAREPNDLDLVSVYPHDPNRCTNEILSICHDRSLGEFIFPVREQNILPMWEYDMFPGIRFHVPSGWGNFTPTIQLDVAFDNRPELPTEFIDLTNDDGLPPVRIRAWTREACLASKICWITNDLLEPSYPELDDISDALLLAACDRIDGELLQLCIIDILTAQKRDNSVFEKWDDLVIRAMENGGLAGRESLMPQNSPTFRILTQREIERFNAERDRTTGRLLYNLTRLLVPLLGLSVWFPPHEEWGFLLQMAENREDRLPSLAYTDWLLDRNDPRGELLQLHHLRLQGEVWSTANKARWNELLPMVYPRWLRYAGIRKSIDLR